MTQNENSNDNLDATLDGDLAADIEAGLLGAEGDNLHRAIESLDAVENEDLKPLLEGVKMTEKELMQVFSKFKIKKTEALDQPFDHNLHQAMVEISSEDHEPGTIIQEMQAGYTLSDRLLRPSMVGVSKK